MKDKLKLLGFLVVFLIALVGLSAVAQAADFEIDRVRVDDITIYEGGDAVYVERGQPVAVEVWIDGTGNGSSYDTRVRAWVGGYEYGEVRAVSDIFEVEAGVDYKKTLVLDMPNDLKASKDYTLHVEVFDDDREVETSYVLRVQETRHKLDITDVIIRPGTTVEAGRPFFTTVRVENMGDNKEENIKVTVSIPELGISARDYIDELAANEDSDANEDNEDEEDSMSSDEIYLKVPETAETGDYQVKITVEYDRGHKQVVATETLHVQGTEDEVPADVRSIISVDSTTQELKAGEEAVYKVMVANLADTKQIYAVEVLGTQLWADTRVDPGFVALNADETGELYVYLTAHDDAKEGPKTLTIRVLAGEATVKEINVGAEVVGGRAGFENWKLGLEIAFLVLVIVLVILGLIIVFRKSGNRDDDEEEAAIEEEDATGLEEPTAAEGQTYY